MASKKSKLKIGETFISTVTFRIDAIDNDDNTCRLEILGAMDGDDPLAVWVNIDSVMEIKDPYLRITKLEKEILDKHSQLVDLKTSLGLDKGGDDEE